MRSQVASAGNSKVISLRFPVRFTLRAALLVMTIVCCVGGWWSNRANRQRSAVATIVRAGGRVEYSYYYEPIHNDSWVRHSEARSIVPRWIRRALGDDYFSTAI